MSAAESAERFYDGKYTERLTQAGSTIRLRRTFLFEPYLTKTDRVLDFGCGPGDLLETLTCNE
jgi:cyclopropane fatty-acyl-phospholipid synthase-like methyltransferase